MSSPSPVAPATALEKHRIAPVSKLSSSPSVRTLLFSCLLIAGVLAVYSPVTQNGFLNYDDDTYITINPHVKAGLTRQTVKWAFTTFDAANYHPVTWLSHALDCQLFGLDPAAHHEVNVLLHAANAVLLFLLLQSATGFAWRSLLVAALFALHPINVESVAWAAERKNVLSMLFFLLALYAYVWYTRQPGLRRYAVMVVFFALALLSKPQVITFPFLLLLLDYWPLGRLGAAQTQVAAAGNAISESTPQEAGANPAAPTAAARSIRWPGIILEKLPLLALSVVSAVVTMKAQKAGGAVQTLSLYSPLLRLETALIGYLRYLGKAFWPTNLVVLYPHPVQLYPAWQVCGAALLLAAITIAVAVAGLRRRDRRYLMVGWFWFLGALFPMIGLIQVGAQAISDRYAYIPFIGIFVMLTWLVFDLARPDLARPGSVRADLAQAERAHADRAARNRAVWLAIPAIAIVLVLGVLTYVQVGYWRDIPFFWTRTIELTENNYVAHDTLAEYLFDRGETEEAARHFRAALAIRPDDLPANLNLGTYDHAHGNLQAAIERYGIVARLAADPSLRAAAYGNLGSAYRQLGDFAKARNCYETALQLNPNRAMAFIGLGLIAQKTGDLPEAVRQYSRAMAVEPTDVGYLLIAQALQQEGKSDEARAIFERVARLSPNLADAQREADSLLGKSAAKKNAGD